MNVHHRIIATAITWAEWRIRDGRPLAAEERDLIAAVSSAGYAETDDLEALEARADWRADKRAGRIPHA